MVSNGSAVRESRVEQEELIQKLHTLRNDILKDVDAKIQTSIDRLITELKYQHKKPQNGFVDNSSSVKDSTKSKELPKKEFVLRSPALAGQWENPELRSLYNCVFAVFVLLYLYLTIFYYLNLERLEYDLSVVSWTLGKFHIVAAIWLAINLSIIFILYPVFRYWATNRISAKNKRLYDSLFCILFVLHELVLCAGPATAIIVCNLPPISSFVVAFEQSRLVMKSYAFVRESIPRALKFKPHQDADKEDSDSYPCPNVEKLIYFLFAPTLIYRDNYPRTSHIRWSLIGWNLLQFFFCLFPYFLAFVWFPVSFISRAGIEPMTLIQFVGVMVVSLFAGGIAMFIGFYITLHNVQETVGELLRFGDRRFYEDWWRCTSFAQFYRSWNILVHDWLYSYVYRDMFVVLGGSRTGAMLTVFIISAIAHEYIMVICLQFLFPLLFTLFITFGVLLVFITRGSTSSFWNIFLWCSLCQGFAMLLVFYSLEWYARINCPRILDTWHDYVVPRSFYCNVISWPS